MGTLKVDNIQTESGSAIITNGAIPVSTLTNSNVGMIKLLDTSASHLHLLKLMVHISILHLSLIHI